MDHGVLKRGLNHMDCDSVNWWMEFESEGKWNSEARPESGG